MANWTPLGEKIFDFSAGAQNPPQFGQHFDTALNIGSTDGVHFDAVLLRVKVEKLKVTYVVWDEGKPVDNPKFALKPAPTVKVMQDPQLVQTDAIPLWPDAAAHARLILVAWAEPDVISQFPHVGARRHVIGTCRFFPEFNAAQVGAADASAVLVSDECAFYADVLASTQRETNELLDYNFQPPQLLTVGQPPLGQLHYSIACTRDSDGDVLPMNAVVTHQVWGSTK